MIMSNNKSLKMSVFIPAAGVVLISVLLGLFNNEMLVAVAKDIFYFSLSDFAWLYQLLAVTTLGVIIYVFCSDVGRIRLGGSEAKPKFSLASNFAMALTGGIATGIVTYSVNEPIIYVGNIYG